MNAKFLKKIFYNKKARRGFKFSKIPAKRKRFNFRKKVNYNFSTKTQTFGPSTVSLNLTGRLNWNMEDNYFNHVELITGFISTDEYKKFADDYEYIKIIGVGVTIYPNDAMNNIPTFIDLDWGGSNMTAEDIVTSDRAKIIYNDSKRQKTFYYRPPDVITHDSYNPRKFNLISNFEYSSLYLSIQQAGGNLRGRVDFRVVFKGPLTKQNQVVLNPEINNIIAKRYLDEPSSEEEKIEKKNENKSKSFKNKSFEKAKIKNEFNLKKDYSVTTNVTNYSFLKGLILEGVESEKIKNSKNFKKLSEINKNKIKKLLNIRKNKKIEGVEKFLEEIKKKKKEKRDEIRKNHERNKKFKINKNHNNEDIIKELEEENERLKLENEELQKKHKENIFDFTKKAGEEQRRIGDNMIFWGQQKQELLSKIQKLRERLKNKKEEEDKKEVEEDIKNEEENLKKVDSKVQESESEFEDFCKRAGVSEDDDNF